MLGKIGNFPRKGQQKDEMDLLASPRLKRTWVWARSGDRPEGQEEAWRAEVTGW